MESITSYSQQQTIDLGAKLAKFMEPGLTLALCGDLGAGKTTFVKGIAAGLEIDQNEVNSPSYVLIREYRAKEMSLFHCDLYRLDKIEDVGMLGLEDYLTDDGVLVIEWAKKAGSFLPPEYLEVDIFHKGENKRRIQIQAKGKKYQKIIKKIKSEL